MKILRASIVFILFWLVLPLWVVLSFLNPETSHVTGLIVPPDEEMLNYVLGILCIFWMCLQFFVATRSRFIEKILPLPYRILSHILMTLGVWLSLTYHAVFKIVTKPDIDIISWSLLFIFYLMIALALSWTPVSGFKWIPKINIRYEAMRLIHQVFALVMIGLMVVHLYAAHVFENSELLANILTIFYLGLSLNAFLLSRLETKRMRMGQVLNIDIGVNLTSMTIKTQKRLDAKIGQFIYIRSKIRGYRSLHPFSIINIEEFSFTIIFQVKGEFTKFLRAMRVSEKLDYSLAYGISPKMGRELILLGTGSGIGVLSGLALMQKKINNDTQVHGFFTNDKDESFEELNSLLQMPHVSIKLRKSGDAHFSYEDFEGIVQKDSQMLICTSQKNYITFYRMARKAGIKRKNIYIEKFYF